MDDLINPDHVPTREECMNNVVNIFGDELTGLLGDGALKHQVLTILRPILAELMSTIGHGIANEIADRCAVEAIKCDALPVRIPAATWRQAETLARTHIETAGGTDVGATDGA